MLSRRGLLPEHHNGHAIPVNLSRMNNMVQHSLKCPVGALKMTINFRVMSSVHALRDVHQAASNLVLLDLGPT